MFYVYILTNKSDRVMYVGVTNDLYRRVLEHKCEVVDGFTKRYHIHKLVYFEEYASVDDAIRREKQIKSWAREKKNDLVKIKNPEFADLFDNQGQMAAIN